MLIPLWTQHANDNGTHRHPENIDNLRATVFEADSQPLGGCATTALSTRLSAFDRFRPLEGMAWLP